MSRVWRVGFSRRGASAPLLLFAPPRSARPSRLKAGCGQNCPPHIWVSLLLFAAAAPASAQVTLSVVQGGVATPVQAYDFGTAALGSVADAQFQLENTGSTAVYLTSLALAGPSTPYFSVVCSLSPELCGAASTQQLPILINPTGTLNFTVQFEPFQLGSPSANLTIAAGNTITVVLSGTGVPGLTLLWNGQPLGAGQTVSFGDVQVGSSQTIALSLANDTSSPLTVPAIPALAGGSFTLAGSALAAPTVAVGVSAELDVIFAPTATGPQQATLTIGLSTYPLQGTGVAPAPPAFPTPSIQFTSTSLASAQQGSLSVNLASPSVSSGSGTVTLAFQSAVSGVSDDPTITFADGTRTATFTVAESASIGQFTDGPSISFGTGTTAGNLVFTVTLGSNTAQANVTIPAVVIGIDAAVAARNVACDPGLVYCTATNVQLQVNGWDNTRSASQIVFSFFDSSGNAIAPGGITVAAGTDFQQYFPGSDLGGVFGLTAFFPVTGDADDVVTAIVQLTNSAGIAQSDQITF